MDDTIEDLCSPWVAALNKTYGTSVKPSDIAEWDMKKAFPGLTSKQIYAPLMQEEFWDEVKPIPGAPEALFKFIKDGYRVIIVTASHPETVSAKLNKVLFRYFPFLTYRDVVVASQKDVISGDVFIDDNPQNLIYPASSGLRILFSRPHNLSFNEFGDGINRYDNWFDIYFAVRSHAITLSLYTYGWFNG